MMDAADDTLLLQLRESGPRSLMFLRIQPAEAGGDARISIYIACY